MAKIDIVFHGKNKSHGMRKEATEASFSYAAEA